MTRHDLIEALEAHIPFDPDEGRDIVRTIRLIETVPDCFHRHEMRGHVTGSSVLLSRDGKRMLMCHHGTLDKWVQFGGHSDGDENTLAVASRELQEESGIAEFKTVSNLMWDVDIHDIPARPQRNEAAHQHFDIAYLFQCTASEEPVISDESHAIEWMTPEQVLEKSQEPRMKRLVAKWRAWQLSSRAA